MKKDFPIELYDYAAKPGLFNVCVHPELLISLVLANLMSPLLWEIKSKIDTRVHNSLRDREPETNDIMKSIHNYTNNKFFHPAPLDRAQEIGVEDIDDIRRVLGSEIVDYNLGVICEGLEIWRRRGVLMPNQDMFGLIDEGKIPCYEYCTTEVIEWYAKIEKKKHRPLGVTSCADETAMSVALAIAEVGLRPDKLVLMGSAIHYTGLIYFGEDGYWFNGKKEYEDAGSWREISDSGTDADIERIFRDRMPALDRIISFFGIHLYNKNETTIPIFKLDFMYDQINRFFGKELDWIREVRETEAKQVSSNYSNFPHLFMLEPKGHEEFELEVRKLAEKYPGSVYDLALYTFRALDVNRPEAYLRASVRGHVTIKAAVEIDSIDSAIDAVLSIRGTASVFGSQDRLAVSDEVLLFNTGDHRDRAMLLYCLIYNAPGIPDSNKAGLEIIYSEERSFVKTGGNIFDVSTMNTVSLIPDSVISLKM